MLQFVAQSSLRSDGSKGETEIHRGNESIGVGAVGQRGSPASIERQTQGSTLNMSCYHSEGCVCKAE